MFPILFQFPDWLPLIGGRALHTYGALVAAGFFAGLLWVRFESKRLGLNPERLLDLFFYIVVAAIIGSRLMYVFASVPQWWRDPLVFIRVWEGGLVFYGGLIASVLISVWYCRRHQLAFFQVADVYTPGIALGHAIGRLGCFAAGCCYGRPAPLGSFFGVFFPADPAGIAPASQFLYATQIFEFVGEMGIFLFLFIFRRYKKFAGEVFLLYIILYPIMRSFLEVFRGDKVRGFLFGGVLSTAQFISIIWFVVAVILWFTIRKKTQITQNL